MTPRAAFPYHARTFHGPFETGKSQTPGGWRGMSNPPPAAEGTHWGMGGARTAGSKSATGPAKPAQDMAIQSIKGFKDLLPSEAERWERIEREARRLFSLYGYAEIRTPILEFTEVFSRSIGR